MGKFYSDTTKAVALATLDACRGNLKQAAAKAGVPIVTLLQWRDGQAINPDVSQLRIEKSDELADRLEDLAHRLIDAVPGKLGEAPLREVALSLGIAIDKMQVLRGQPDAITGNVYLSDTERAERIADLFERAAKAGTGPAASLDTVAN